MRSSLSLARRGNKWPSRRWWATRCLPLLPLLLPLNACFRPTYPADSLAEKVSALCLKEEGIDVRVSLVGKTLYLACALEGFVTDDLNLRSETLKAFEGLALAGTRAALSTDAAVDFLVIQATDPRLKSALTILRYMPDLKGYFYMKYSRGDFEERMVLESALEPENGSAVWHDVTLPEYMARLLASLLQRRMTGNPLMSAFLEIRTFTGTAAEGTLSLVALRSDKSSKAPLLNAVLETAIEDLAAGVLRKYDPKHNLVSRVTMVDDRGVLLWERDASALILKTK